MGEKPALLPDYLPLLESVDHLAIALLEATVVSKGEFSKKTAIIQHRENEYYKLMLWRHLMHLDFENKCFIREAKIVRNINLTPHQMHVADINHLNKPHEV